MMMTVMTVMMIMLIMIAVMASSWSSSQHLRNPEFLAFGLHRNPKGVAFRFG